MYIVLNTIIVNFTNCKQIKKIFTLKEKALRQQTESVCLNIEEKNNIQLKIWISG